MWCVMWLYENHSHKKCDYFEHNKLNKHLADDNCLSVGKIGSFSEKKSKNWPVI